MLKFIELTNAETDRVLYLRADQILRVYDTSTSDLRSVRCVECLDHSCKYVKETVEEVIDAIRDSIIGTL